MQRAGAARAARRHGVAGAGLHGAGTGHRRDRVGRVLRRGRSLVNCGAEIVDPEGTLLAKALATYQVG
ncbi:hypothetical protein I551_6450 [Mycobacterium ulcerans str. Harvey]|uniref:CN hydrolase domain-containing protein n=1 Tax=Mycobacterium ulcerans str. Harvey TaxID=1299332 RepID=A0ABN0QQV2_MYCUL|nr:hypothetical protein I551_6450 [Mycobacterium ulcerans str. Harvey]